MVVATPYLLGRALVPSERHAVLVVNADAVPAVREPLKPIAGRLCHIGNRVRPLQLVEQPACARPQFPRELPPGVFRIAPIEDVFGPCVRIAPYHEFTLYMDYGYT